MTKPKSYWLAMEDEFGQYGDRAKCRVCGRVYKFLGAHIKAHDLTEMEYKDKFFILHSLPLCIPETSAKLSESTRARIEKGELATDEMVENLVSSSRMSGKTQSPAALESLKERNLDSESKEQIRKLGRYWKNREKEPEHIRRIANSLKRYYAEDMPKIESTCDQCGKSIFRSTSRTRTRNFCNRRCFAAYTKMNNSWVRHIKKLRLK